MSNLTISTRNQKILHSLCVIFSSWRLLVRWPALESSWYRCVFALIFDLASLLNIFVFSSILFSRGDSCWPSERIACHSSGNCKVLNRDAYARDPWCCRAWCKISHNICRSVADSDAASYRSVEVVYDSPDLVPKNLGSRLHRLWSLEIAYLWNFIDCTRPGAC